MAQRMIFLATSALGVSLLLSGCAGSDAKKKDEGQVGIDEAESASVPKKLRDKLLGSSSDESEVTKNAIGANYLMGPLDTQLQQLKVQAEADRKSLSTSKEQADEFRRRTEETQASLRRTEEKIVKVEKIIRMLNDNPNALDGNLGLTHEATTLAGVPALNEAGPMNDEMSALGANSPLKGGPGTSFQSPENSLPRNELNVPDRSGAQPQNSLAPLVAPVAPGWNIGGQSSLSPLSDTQAIEGPELTESANAVWKEKSAPLKTEEGKILLCDGEGAGMEFMISLGKKDGLTEGMLFEATGANHEKNVLVVTRVYNANSEAKLHPRFASGGLKDGIPLKKLPSLPQ